MTRLLAGIVLTACAGSSTPGGKTPRPSDPLETILDANDRALLAVDRAIAALGDTTADAHVIVRATARTFHDQRPSASHATLASMTRELDAFIERLPSRGTEFRCGADFERHRARDELLHIRGTLLGEAWESLEPAFCAATPPLIDLARPPADRRTVEIYGVDFNRVELQLVIVANGSYQDATPALVVRNDHHVTANLEKVALPTGADGVGLAWGNLLHGTIPLVQETTMLCVAREETIGDVSIELTPRALALATPAGPASERSASASLHFDSNALDAVACMATADGAGRVTSTACASGFLATIDPDRVIEGIVSASRDTMSLRVGNSVGASRDAARLVKTWTLGTPATIAFEPVRVISIPRDGCLSPLAFIESARRGVLGQQTERRLRPQLASMPPSVQMVRPRFVPPR